jgi:hypothetical protein
MTNNKILIILSVVVYGCEKWTLSEIKNTDCKYLGEIFGPEKEEVTGKLEIPTEF